VQPAPIGQDRLAAAPELLPLIGPADDRSPMWSDAPRSVGSVGTTNRMVVPMTVMVRICLVNSHSPIGTDASGSVDSIDTGGCVARLGEHERAKCNHDGEHRCAISGDAQHRSFHFGYLLVTGARMISSLLYNENPGHHDRGISVLTAFRDAGKCIISVGRQVDAGSVCQYPLKLQQIPTN